MLVHETREGIASGQIVEVEAYLGPADRAAHTFGGRRTPRNEVMWGAPGHAYVYFTYGMHFCMNVVTRAAGIPQAVLLRALMPVAGIDLMRRRRRRSGELPANDLARGPANLCRALGIDQTRDGADLVTSPLHLLPGEAIGARQVVRSPRVGIDYAGDYVSRPWRLAIADHPAVSRPRVRRTS